MADKNVKLKDGQDILFPQTKVSLLINEDGTPYVPLDDNKVNEIVTAKGYQTSSQVNSIIDSKKLQPQLVSGTNVKTLNGESILGSGNLEISGGGNLFFKPFVKIINFTIDGQLFEAEENMTWATWVDSKYNTSEYTNSGSSIKFGLNRQVYENTILVNPNDLIKETQYILKNIDSGSGGTN